MNIVRIHIDGFGSFFDAEIGPFESGLNVVLGENEAGKSTLLDFVRGALYGFVDQRTPRSFHAPLQGGRHGGSIAVLDARGTTLTIERFQKRPVSITTDTGEQVGDPALSVLLGHTDKRSFESIFAFGLDELAQADRLHEDGVRDLIFSAGVAGAGRSASMTIRRLEEERSQLIRNARNADQRSRLHQLTRDREAIIDQLHAARAQSGSFVRLSREIEQLGSAADAAVRHQRSLELRKAQLEDLSRAESSMLELKALKDALASIPPADAGDEIHLVELRNVEDLRSRLDGHARNVEELDRLEREESDRSVRIETLRARIGIVDFESIPREVTLGVRQEVTSVAAAAQTAEHQIRIHEESTLKAGARLSEHRRELAALTADRDPDIFESARQRLTEIPTLRSMLGELRDLDHEIELASERLALARPMRIDARNSLQILLGMFIVLGIAAVAIALSHRSLGAVTSAALGIVSVMIAAISITLLRRQNRSAESVDSPLDSRIAERETRAERIAERFVSIGLPPGASESELEELEAILRDSALEAERIRAAVRAEQQAAEQLRTAERELDDARGELARSVAAAGVLSARLGLAEPVDPGALEEVVRAIDELLELVRADTEAKTRRKGLDGVIAKFEGDVAELLARCDVPASTPGGVEPIAPAKTGTPDELRRRLDELSQRCATISARERSRSDLEGSIASVEGQLGALFGRYDNAEELRGELVALSGTERETELDAIAVASEEATREYRTLLEGRRDRKTEFDALLGSTSIADLEIALESLNAEIDASLTHWSLLGVTTSLIKRSLNRYEIERQPAVIGRAGALFADVTEGRYTSLVSTEDDQRRSLRVIRADGTPLDAQFLSRGTAEQLYLCVRLAYAMTFAERSVALPLIFDDVLVNFDPDRMAQMSRAIATVARDHQILLFTCHPHIVDVLRDKDPDLRLIELPGRAGH